MDLQKKLKDVNEEQVSKGPSTVNNALFVGSTAELAKLLKNGAPKEDKSGVNKKEAEEIKAKLEAAGAKVELK